MSDQEKIAMEKLQKEQQTSTNNKDEKSDDDGLKNASEPVEQSDNESNYEPLVGEKVKKSGLVTDKSSGNVIGRLVKGKAEALDGKVVGEHGVVKDDSGSVVGQVEPVTLTAEKEVSNKWVNELSPVVRKSGKVLDGDDNLVGHVDERVAEKWAGFKVDKEGHVFDIKGDIVGKAQMIEEKKPNPYAWVNESSPEVKKSGKVLDQDDNLVGNVDKRAAEKLAGFKVDDEGNIVNHDGNVVGKAEMIKDEEPKVEEKKNPYPWINEKSPEVKKSGKVLDGNDNLVGHVDRRVADKWAGFKVDDEGNVVDNEGNVVGKAELVKEKEPKVEEKKNPYPWINENSPEVKKSGKVVDQDDNIIGSVEKRAAEKLAGNKVDDEGNIIDSEGNIVGKAELFKEEAKEEPIEEKKFSNPNPRIHEFSPEVKSSGKVLDNDDNIIGSVDKNAAHGWAGFKVDSEGNIINHEGNVVGKAELVKEKTDEEKQAERDEQQKLTDKEKEEEEYRKLATLMANSIQQSLDKVKPVLRMITENIDAEEAKPSNERDEQKLVDTVKPLIEQATNILSEADGAIRGLDPSGKIAKTAQAKTSQREASPEEYHLADLLSQLAGEVTTTIEKAKKKVKNMPLAKKALSPLWNVLQSPLLQILSAVGLLLTGVLGLVGNLLNGLGLGSILNSLLGGIGLNKILEGFGLGKALGGDKK